MLRIPCPHCGLRDHTEFDYRGDATKVRPAADAELAAWVDFVYLRNNPKGMHSEYWQHTRGCRSWVVVRRDTMTHDIPEVADSAIDHLAQATPPTGTCA